MPRRPLRTRPPDRASPWQKPSVKRSSGGPTGASATTLGLDMPRNRSHHMRAMRRLWSMGPVLPLASALRLRCHKMAVPHRPKTWAEANCSLPASWAASAAESLPDDNAFDNCSLKAFSLVSVFLTTNAPSVVTAVRSKTTPKTSNVGAKSLSFSPARSSQPVISAHFVNVRPMASATAAGATIG